MNNISFDDKRIAKGYAKDRPWLHKSVIERIKSECNINKPFKNGLDVGCGAGLSTKALKLICDKVTGTDISDEMIQVCKTLYNTPEFSFYTAKAEETKIPESPYDIVTAAGVVNWVDKNKFLKNMKSVMVNNGLLIVYDFWISDKMLDNDAYTDWYQNHYLINFPKPPRNEAIWHQKDMPDNFIIEKQFNFQLNYEYDIDSFIRFMLLQSNVNTQIDAGHKTETEIHSWMKKTLNPIFQDQPRTLLFNGYAWICTLKL
ncbi:MAG: class I SAM-dependent methyltransferase [Lachnospiraceae bacterium]|nr:class I SAM-dependent methyltransferase [Lachnospiraceae bacterium]